MKEEEARWLAAVNGIKLDEPTESPEEIVERMKRKAEAINEGKTEEEFEFDEIGLDIEVED